MALEQINIQGLAYDHSAVRINLNSSQLTVPSQVKNFIKSISWNSQLDSQIVQGVQLSPLGATMGSYHGTFEMSIIKEGWDLLHDALPDGWMAFVFDSISITFINPKAVIPTVTEIFGCRIIKVDSSVSLGGKEIEVKLGFIVTGVISENGKYPIPIDQDNPGSF
jgi:hypothetical protein